MANTKIHFTPGPSELYPTVQKHMNTVFEEKIGVISHRSKAFQELYKNTTDQLRKLIQIPDDFEILFLSSATEIWERIMQNCVEQKSFHCVNGSFSKRFYEFAGELGREAYKVEVPLGKGFDVDSIQVPADAEIICLTHNETSTGVSMPESDIAKFRSKNPNALIFVDAVSSLPYPKFDWKSIDSTFFSVQKCFGLPAGLGVWILNKKVIERANAIAAKGKSIGTYHTIPSMLSKAVANQTPETPNVVNIFLLGKVCEDMNKLGGDTIRKETELKAAMLEEYIAKSKTFSFGVDVVAHRSKTTIVANTTLAPAEVNKILAPYNMAVGAGYGSNKETQIRIANFPTHSIKQISELIDALEKHAG